MGKCFTQRSLGMDPVVLNPYVMTKISQSISSYHVDMVLSFLPFLLSAHILGFLVAFSPSCSYHHGWTPYSGFWFPVMSYPQKFCTQSIHVEIQTVCTQFVLLQTEADGCFLPFPTFSDDKKESRCN